MFRIAAQSRFLDLKKSFKQYYVLALGAFMSILTFALYKDYIVVITMVVCTFAGYVLLIRSPKSIQVVLTPEHLQIDDVTIPWTACSGWAMVDLGTMIEFVVQSTNLTHPFYYFYISEKNPYMKQFVLQLSQSIPYSAEVPNKNMIHQLLRRWGLK